jgi:hypothetical protein
VKAPTALGFVGLLGATFLAAAFTVWCWLYLHVGWFALAGVLIVVVFVWAAWGSWVDYRHRRRDYEAWQQGDRPILFGGSPPDLRRWEDQWGP